MGKLVLSMLLFGVLIYGVVTIVDKYSAENLFEQKDEQPLSTKPPLYFPADMELLSNDGGRLDVSVIARTESVVQFIRKGDGQVFAYPMKDLTPDTQEELLRFPITQLENLDAHLKSGEVTFGDIYVNELRARVVKIDSQIRLLSQKHHVSNSIAEKRKIRNEISELTSEKTDLRSKIDERLASAR